MKGEADMRGILNLIVNEEGQGMAEYAIILTFAVVVVIIAINAFGIAVRGNINNSVNKISSI